MPKTKIFDVHVTAMVHASATLRVSAKNAEAAREWVEDNPSEISSTDFTIDDAGNEPDDIEVDEVVKSKDQQTPAGYEAEDEDDDED